MNAKLKKYEKFELPPSSKEFDEIAEDVIEEDVIEEDTNMSPEQEAELEPIDDSPDPKPQTIKHKQIKAKIEDGKLVAVDEPITDELPLIEETHDNTQEDISEIEVEEADKLRFNIIQLDMKNMELESKLLEQKYQRLADNANIYIKDLKTKYNVADNWKYNPNTGVLIKS